MYLIHLLLNSFRYLSCFSMVISYMGWLPPMKWNNCFSSYPAVQWTSIRSSLALTLWKVVWVWTKGAVEFKQSSWAKQRCCCKTLSQLFHSFRAYQPKVCTCLIAKPALNKGIPVGVKGRCRIELGRRMARGLSRHWELGSVLWVLPMWQRPGAATAGRRWT